MFRKFQPERTISYEIKYVKKSFWKIMITFNTYEFVLENF